MDSELYKDIEVFKYLTYPIDELFKILKELKKLKEYECHYSFDPDQLKVILKNNSELEFLDIRFIDDEILQTLLKLKNLKNFYFRGSQS